MDFGMVVPAGMQCCSTADGSPIVANSCDEVTEFCGNTQYNPDESVCCGPSDADLYSVDEGCPEFCGDDYYYYFPLVGESCCTGTTVGTASQGIVVPGGLQCCSNADGTPFAADQCDLPFLCGDVPYSNAQHNCCDDVNGSPFLTKTDCPSWCGNQSFDPNT